MFSHRIPADGKGAQDFVWFRSIRSGGNLSANLRHQTEYELRTKLIQLRRLYIPASVSVEKLLALMSDSLASFAALSALS